MNPALPDWWCERCEHVVTGIADTADPADKQVCPHCRKHTVIWLTPEKFFATQPVRCPAEKESAAGPVTPATVAATKQEAAAWFARMRDAAGPEES